MFTIKIILLLLWLAALSSILTRAFVQKIPQPLILILLGSVAALCGFHVKLHPELFLFVFLPPLLFVDAFHMPLREFKQLRGPILFLAFGLVVINTIACGYLIHWILPNLLLSVCFTLAAALSPTDTVAVSSLIEGKPVPSRLLQILSGEALFNDASGLVCFRFATIAALIGEFSYEHAFKAFLFVAIGGIVIGAVLAWLAAKIDHILIRYGFDEAQSQILLLLLLPFLLYAVAEYAGCSGILAAVAGCMMLKLSGVVEESKITTRIQANTVLNIVSYTFNALIFLFLGFQLPSLLQKAQLVVQVHNVTMWRFAWVVLIIYGIMFCIRMISVWISVSTRWIMAHLRHTEFEPLSLAASFLLTFAGVRGAVTLAAVLSLPTGINGTQIFPSRETVIVIATGVIILSLLLASVAIPFCLRFIPPEFISKSAQEENHARQKLINAALTVLNKAHEGVFPSPEKQKSSLSEEEKLMRLEITERLQRLYKSRLETEDIAYLENIPHGSTTLRRVRFELALRLQILRIQRQTMRDMMTQGDINDQTEWKIQEEIDYEEQVIRSRIKRLSRSRKPA